MMFSAVIPSYRRVTTLKVLADNLRQHSFVDDIVIFHNDVANPIAARQLGMDVRGVLIVNSIENWYTYGRFYAAKQFAMNDAILTCDDDNLVHNWPSIADAYELGECKYVVSAMPPGHVKYQDRQRHGASHEVLLGWGAAFDRRWIDSAFDQYIDEYGRDHIMLRKADRLFTMLRNRPHTVMRANFTQLYDTDRAVDLWQQSDHVKLTREARKRAWHLLDRNICESPATT
jgi:hypothetical protein